MNRRGSLADYEEVRCFMCSTEVAALVYCMSCHQYFCLDCQVKTHSLNGGHQFVSAEDSALAKISTCFKHNKPFVSFAYPKIDLLCSTCLEKVKGDKLMHVHPIVYNPADAGSKYRSIQSLLTAQQTIKAEAKKALETGQPIVKPPILLLLEEIQGDTDPPKEDAAPRARISRG